MQPKSPGSFARLDPEVCRLLGEIMRESRGRLRCVMLCTASAKQALAVSDSAWPGAEVCMTAQKLGNVSTVHHAIRLKHIYLKPFAVH